MNGLPSLYVLEWSANGVCLLVIDIETRNTTLCFRRLPSGKWSAFFDGSNPLASYGLNVLNYLNSGGSADALIQNEGNL